ncbi:small ubiquitin-related modifier 2-like [Phalaenopsis equestris]|uniref:small ubiquitin-related modifier 2-like n=1 Tax=Phalaenopsis equestris TaxID=78828 RepID=UPI0009E40F2F|nr:small ubiquitin-related modifier 2-like [Phalaenopsis equestris]
MSGGRQEDKKPEQSEYIILKTQSQDGNEVFFKINRGTPLMKLMTAYCDRMSVDFSYVRFLFEGSRLHGERTPEELHMEDDDQIDVVVSQDGGCMIIYV